VSATPRTPDDRIKLTVRISPASYRKLLREYAWRMQTDWITWQVVIEAMIEALPERDITDDEAAGWSDRR
jgi:hypothetical protein